jgi:hypothetical protein
MRRSLTGAAAVLALAALGCSEDETVPGGGGGGCPSGQVVLDDGSCGPPPPCQPGEVTVEAGCEPAGLPADMPCAPGEWQRDDGGCVPAGVPVEDCAQGFVHDGDRGCEPVLPSTVCARGQIAVPGDSSCREVAPCAPGTWGDIVTSTDTQHVDAAYVGGNNDGSQSAPWLTIGEAVTAAASGATVAIAAGSYAEDVVVRNKSLLLWGRCPSMVEIAGVGQEVAAVLLREGSTGSTVRGVGITGSGFGLLSTAGTGVLIDRVWIYDTPARGLDAEDSIGASELTVRDSLIENVTDMGITILGAEVTIERSVVRGTRPANNQSGRGVNAADGVVHVNGSVIEGSTELGIGLFNGTVMDINGSVVRDTLEAGSGALGWGISADLGVELSISGSYIRDNVDYGISARGAMVTIDSTVIRGVSDSTVDNRGVGVRAIDHMGTQSVLDIRTSLVETVTAMGIQVGSSQMFAQGVVLRDANQIGWGAYIHQLRDTSALASAVIDGVVSERNRDAGILVFNADATISNTLIRDIYGPLGRGIDVEDRADLARSQVTVHSTLVERTYESALFSMGAVVTAERCHFRDAVADGSKGRGVAGQYDFYTMLPAVVQLLGTRVENSVEFNVFIIGSDVELVDSTLSTAVGLPDGLHGDGLMIESFAPASSSAIVRNTLIENSNRAAIVSFGANVSLQSNTFRCQVLDLDGELGLDGGDYAFKDEGGNVCGCPEATGECKVLSTGLAPPEPLETE